LVAKKIDQKKRRNPSQSTHWLVVDEIDRCIG